MQKSPADAGLFLFLPTWVFLRLIAAADKDQNSHQADDRQRHLVRLGNRREAHLQVRPAQGIRRSVVARQRTCERGRDAVHIEAIRRQRARGADQRVSRASLESSVQAIVGDGKRGPGIEGQATGAQGDHIVAARSGTREIKVEIPAVEREAATEVDRARRAEVRIRARDVHARSDAAAIGHRCEADRNGARALQ